MSDIVERAYSGKLLLFGEYTVINGSSALAIPLNEFHGKWNKSANVDLGLLAFSEFLKHSDANRHLNLSQFNLDIQKGWFFNSNIPFGYGAGSSGALCAGILDRYGINNETLEQDTNVLKNVFAEMEAFFHGTSSGLDPLVSYLSNAVYYKKDSFLKTIQIQNDLYDSIFLLDTGIERKTAPFVKIYNEKLKNSAFLKNIEVLSILNENAIDAYIKNDRADLINYFKQISEMQYQYFQEMIPESFKVKWQASLSNPKLSLKLCGAGGGGFIIGINH